MTDNHPEPSIADKHAPFGTQPRRSKLVVIFLGLLYLVWLAVLFWMAAFKAGQ